MRNENERSNVSNLATGASKTSGQHENRISALRPILSSVVARGTELVAGASTDSLKEEDVNQV